MHHILFICNRNSCCSIMAEALFNHIGKMGYVALSAGSSPVGHVHPTTLSTLKKNNVLFEGLRSKSWNEFSHQPIYAVVAACTEILDEDWPLFAGKPARIHWDISDPAKARGTDVEIDAVFDSAFLRIEENVRKLIEKLP